MSIRQPAALCNLVGLKPTFGLVSQYGAMPLSPSLDLIGPITRTVADAALLLSAIAGPDDRDPMSRVPGDWDGAFHPRADARGLRIGLPQSFFFDDCDPATEAAVRAAIARFAELGATIVPIDLPHMDELNRLASIIAQSEAAAFHAEDLAARPETFGPSIGGFLKKGLGHAATTYVAALGRRRAIAAEIEPLLASVDAVATPTTPVPATLISDGPARDELLRWRYTCPFTTLGHPAVSVPCGFTGEGLPIGLQLVGHFFGDMALLSLASAYESATAWHEHQIRHG